MLLNDALITKLSSSPVTVAWHQDPPYQGETGRSFTTGHANFVVDIYLDPATRESGCIFVLPGRHLSGRLALESHGDDRLFTHEEAVPIIAEPGDVGFHALSVPHGSARNTTQRPRRILMFHYVTRQTYDMDYRDWMHAYGGFGAEALSLLRRGVALRKTVYPDEDYGLLRMDDDGIRYLGDDAFAPDHWRDMISSFSDAEHEHRRMLG
jgi:ectoine hydroxylase-related dioxygenase (phytanoyl-CoA dioxygenase family)